MNKLFQIILDQLAFHELSDDDSIDPDVAVSQLESIIAALSDLPEAILEEFTQYTFSQIEKEKDDDLKEVYKCIIESLDKIK